MLFLRFLLSTYSWQGFVRQLLSTGHLSLSRQLQFPYTGSVGGVGLVVVFVGVFRMFLFCVFVLCYWTMFLCSEDSSRIV